MTKDNSKQCGSSCSGNCPCSGDNMFKIWILAGALIGLAWYLIQ